MFKCNRENLNLFRALRHSQYLAGDAKNLVILPVKILLRGGPKSILEAYRYVSDNSATADFGSGKRVQDLLWLEPQLAQVSIFEPDLNPNDFKKRSMNAVISIGSSAASDSLSNLLKLSPQKLEFVGICKSGTLKDFSEFEKLLNLYQIREEHAVLICFDAIRKQRAVARFGSISAATKHVSVAARAQIVTAFLTTVQPSFVVFLDTQLKRGPFNKSLNLVALNSNIVEPKKVESL
jgi:hypothetical protein